MNILILGSGGREHAFAWKIKQSKHSEKLYVAPGNAGTASVAENISININDFEGIGGFCLKNNIKLLIVGPEEPLVNGIKDFFVNNDSLNNILVIGPDKLGARLEGSKDYSKSFMSKYNIPTANACTVSLDQIETGYAFLEKQNAPYVLKADGLAAGKGVIITDILKDAKSALKRMLEGQFGEASRNVLIEEYLNGIELSIFVLTDGENYKILPEAKDYKRIGEGDTGPNTGGMGAVSPVDFADKSFMTIVDNKIIKPTIDGIKTEGMNYKGFVFIGLMNVNGEPYVIEYNVRMGDPETQVVLPRINNDFAELLIATANGSLNNIDLEVSSRSATTVVAVAEGYPNTYDKGDKISGLSESNESTIFHAGTKNQNGEILTNGGRVLAATGLGDHLEDALESSYQSLSTINWNGIYYRKDIGKDLTQYDTK